MTEPSVFFDDAAAYEAFMGRWTRSAGALFLNWIAPPKNSHWLDIGCGTGVFTDNAFDVVVSALVINFIPDRPKALAEMRRVGRAGGAVAGYVWDFAGERSPGSLLRIGLHEIGVEVADIPGTTDSGLDALQSLFERAGLEQIANKAIDVTMPFANFDDLWRAQMQRFGPRGKAVAALSDADRARLMDKVRASLPVGPDGSVAYSARTHAVKARIPQ